MYICKVGDFRKGPRDRIGFPNIAGESEKHHFLKSDILGNAFKNIGNTYTFLCQKHWIFVYLLNGIQKTFVFKFMYLLEIIKMITPSDVFGVKTLGIHILLERNPENTCFEIHTLLENHSQH